MKHLLLGFGVVLAGNGTLEENWVEPAGGEFDIPLTRMSN